MYEEENNDLNQYRILCKNGSLAVTTGLNLDKPELCALSVTIDSEVNTLYVFIMMSLIF